MQRMCYVLKVVTSSYQAWRRRQAKPGETGQRRGWRCAENEQLVCVMRQIDEEVNHRYGSPRMHAELVRRGFVCNIKRVARLTLPHRIAATHSKRRRRVVTTQSNHGLPLAPNMLSWRASSLRSRPNWLPTAVSFPLRRRMPNSSAILRASTIASGFIPRSTTPLLASERTGLLSGVNSLPTLLGDDHCHHELSNAQVVPAGNGG